MSIGCQKPGVRIRDELPVASQRSAVGSRSRIDRGRRPEVVPDALASKTKKPPLMKPSVACGFSLNSVTGRP